MTDEQWSARRTSFGSQADAYSYGRPSYPSEAVRWVLPGSATTVLDLGAGTGKVTATLLELGIDVIAVEPLAEMRALIPAAATAIDGSAEQIPLDDACVDAVVVGQAFHWFDPHRALPEIARVLRPGGTVGLLWNLADDRVDWVAQVCEVIGDEARVSLTSPDPTPPYAGTDELSTPERRVFPHTQDYDADRICAMWSSFSGTILMTEAERAARLDAVRRMLPAGAFAYPLVCECWRGERR